MIIKIDLPEYENFPQQFATQYANGRIDYKYKRQDEIYYDYRKCVFGLAVFVAGNIFNMIPKIDEMIVSGYSQRNDGNGKIIDDYLYSIVFDRESLSMHKLNEEDPFKLCMSFKNRCECNDKNRLLSVEPFEQIYDIV